MWLGVCHISTQQLILPAVRVEGICRFQRFFSNKTVSIINMVIFVICTVLLCGIIGCFVRKQTRWITAEPACTSKMAKTMALILGMFCFSNLVFCLALDLIDNNPIWLVTRLDVTTWLGISKSLVNSIVYSHRDRGFRRAFWGSVHHVRPSSADTNDGGSE